MIFMYSAHTFRQMYKMYTRLDEYEKANSILFYEIEVTSFAKIKFVFLSGC